MDKKSSDLNSSKTVYQKIVDFLTQMQRANAPKPDEWLKLEIILESEHWELFGQQLLYMAREMLFNDENRLFALYEDCLLYAKDLLDPYLLVDILEVIMRAMRADRDPLNMLRSISETIEVDADASQYLQILQAYLLFHTHGKIEIARQYIESLRAEIVTEQSKGKQQPRNFVKFHVLAAQFYFRIGEWPLSFASRMQYLEADLHNYPKMFWAEQAYLLVVNALLVEDKYDFEDVKKHEILEALRSTEWEYILDVLNAFSMGNLERFKKLRFLWMVSKELRDNEAALFERIYVLTVLAVATKRLRLPCYIHFVDFAMELGMAAADVVPVVRRAIDTGLMVAKINLLDEVVEINFLNSICDKFEVDDDENAEII